MDSFTELLRGWMESENNVAGLGLMAASAAIEYVFPPFPGDAVTVMGAILVTAYGWSFALVLAAVMLGSLVGAGFAYQVGVWWARRRAAHPEKPHRPSIQAVIARFQKHGPTFIMVNRFLPGIRSFIFVAAGLAGIHRGKVLGYAALSALMWNLGLMALGALVGANLDQLQTIVERYTLAVWIVLTALVVIWAVRRWRKKRRDPAPG